MDAALDPSGRDAALALALPVPQFLSQRPALRRLPAQTNVQGLAAPLVAICGRCTKGIVQCRAGYSARVQVPFPQPAQSSLLLSAVSLTMPHVVQQARSLGPGGGNSRNSIGGTIRSPGRALSR